MRGWVDEAGRKMTNTASAGHLKVTLVRSTIGFDRRQAEVVKGLGLRRLGHTVELQDVPSIRGMIRKVRHLVCVSEVEA
jgi:large subunit ribosomal protein L30|tara:strand:- start:616 stop:852 length:237 start_codon:yes stop_codon:yes gene_type:complete